MEPNQIAYREAEETREMLARPLLSTQDQSASAWRTSLDAGTVKFFPQRSLSGDATSSSEGSSEKSRASESGRERPAYNYQLKGTTIYYDKPTRIRYHPFIKSQNVLYLEFNLQPRPRDILEIEKGRVFRKNDLSDDEMKILMKFDRIQPLINPVRNQPDFRGKLGRFFKVCRRLGASKGTSKDDLWREAHILLDAMESTVQETMSPIHLSLRSPSS